MSITVIKLKCKYCNKEIISLSKTQANYNYGQHIKFCPVLKLSITDEQWERSRKARAEYLAGNQ